MRKLTKFLILSMVVLFTQTGRADFTLSFDSGDFGITSTFNDVSLFQFDIVIDDTLTPGATYSDPALTSVDYRVNGVLASPTPSGFPGFALVRSISGADFYNLSPEASIEFTVSSTADLTDGLQMNELDGTGTVFTLNARELDQNPGRYHPPIFTLDSDGTGRLVNSNNQSIFPNPDPPIGSGLLVDVNVADEYDVGLTFLTSLTVSGPVAIPEPSSAMLLAAGGAMLLLRRRRVS